jgi:hypothetical protein
MQIPRAEADYLDAVVARLGDVLGDALVGVYPSGSISLDGYRPGRSDLDLIAVAERPSPGDLDAISSALAHNALPCPATGLELVVYDRVTLAGLSTEAGFALNLNTGRELPAKVETEPGDGPQFWYPIDRDMVHQHRRVLCGPAFAELSTRQPYAVLLPVVIESVAVHLYSVAEQGDNAVLNGCRALRFHTERSWSAKPAAATWVLRHTSGFEPLIAAALDSHRRDRAAGQVVDTGEAKRFLSYVEQRLRS